MVDMVKVELPAKYSVAGADKSAVLIHKRAAVKLDEKVTPAALVLEEMTLANALPKLLTVCAPVPVNEIVLVPMVNDPRFVQFPGTGKFTLPGLNTPSV